MGSHGGTSQAHDTRTDDAQPFEHDPDLWFRDGSIIIVCGPLGFRVNESILSVYSPVFKDMFAFADPSCEEMHEGCPVVRLMDGSNEMRNFLMMMYDRSFGRNKQNLGLAKLAGVLRVASKYQCSQIRRELVEQLMSLFPTDLNTYRSMREKQLLGLLWPTSVNPMLITQAALECDLPSLLPCALYSSSFLDIDAILRGVIRGVNDIKLAFNDEPQQAASPIVRELIIRFRDAFFRRIRSDLTNPQWFPAHSPCVRKSAGCRGTHCHLEALKRYLGGEDVFYDEPFIYPEINESDYKRDREIHPTLPCYQCHLHRKEFERRNYHHHLWNCLPALVPGKSWKTWRDVTDAQNAFDHSWMS